MEIFFSAVLSELFVDKYPKQPMQAMEVTLERILLRAQVIMDEAAGRHVTNQGMLRQLSMLSDAMYRGFYVLDAFRCRAIEEDGVGDHHAVSNSWALSKFSYAKHLCLSSGRTTKISQELEEVLDSLRTVILDVSESVLFLSTYPRLNRQPYNMHMLLEKCMFGRQMETELLINFLLHTQPCSTSPGRFDVLPIVGPARAGKTTLVTHVCNDERVREHFSQIMFIGHGNFTDGEETILGDGCTTKHEKNDKSLIVFEVVGELKENLGRRLRSLSRRCTTNGSKMIITSQSDKIKELGTTQAMTLKHLPYEAYWYFFKVITFGSTNPEMHVKHTYLAMEIARMLNGSLVAANVTGRMLRANFSIHFWCKVLNFTRRAVERHLSMFGKHPTGMLDESKPANHYRLGRTTADLFISDQYQTCSSREELPKITMQDVVYGGVKSRGTFKVLSWKSRIPPYQCYIYTCEIQEPKTGVVKRKRSLNNNSIGRI